MAAGLLTYAQAAELVQLYIRALRPQQPSSARELRPTERIPLEATLGRVLAEPISADRDLPPFPRSTRDGFACRSAEANTHLPLQLTRQVRAGESVPETLNSGEVWEIMTGAPVPEGADAVFMVEHAALTSDSASLEAPRSVEPGENIVPRGAEAPAGALLLPPGVRLGSAQIALAAQCGYPQLAVYAKPRVAILSTGDELVSIDTQPGPGQIRNSNSPMLAALVTAAGGVPLTLPVVADNQAAVEQAIELARSPDLAAELILFTGGISAGRFDLVKDGLTRAGAHFSFAGVAIQPGKPIVFGQLPRFANPDLPAVPFFALPGNPISSAVTFQLFAAPVLAALANDPSPAPRFASARLSGVWHGKPGLTRFLPAWCDFALDPEVKLVPWQGSGDVAAYGRSNCFLVLPSEADTLASGTLVQILLP